MDAQARARRFTTLLATVRAYGGRGQEGDVDWHRARIIEEDLVTNEGESHDAIASTIDRADRLRR